mgnify:CR=1 FL=1
MENIEYSKDLVSDIKDMLLKYCPYMENRLDLIDSKEKEFDIIYILDIQMKKFS